MERRTGRPRKDGRGVPVCVRSCRRRRCRACALVALTALTALWAGTPALQHGAAVQLAPGGVAIGALPARGLLLRLRGAGQAAADRCQTRAPPHSRARAPSRLGTRCLAR